VYALRNLERRDDRPMDDGVVVLSGVTWDDYERLLEIRGERGSPRYSYVEGTLEIMSPSQDHEKLKSLIGRLVEAYCLERGVRFSPFGSWTLKDKALERGVEPDECYILGGADVDRPHLAIEVVWTSGRIDKLGIYQKLGVQEVWYWRKGHIRVYALRADREAYEEVDASELLPGLDLELVVRFLDRPTAYDAICDFRAALKSSP
jgi:Uma2 family endonuclease